MESVKELPLFSEVNTVSIKNYHDKVVVDLHAHLEKLLETASAYAPSHAIPSGAIGMASEINAASSVVHLSSSNSSLKTSGRALTVKEPPLEIVIEHPLDERALLNLSRLLGEHTPASLSQEEAASLIALLGKNQVDHLKIKSTGVRFIFRILEQTFRPLYRLPPQFEYFTGRKEELAALREGRDTVKVIAPRETLPEEEKQDNSISQIAGTGGIGKSQLANYYARLQFREKKYDWVIWITGGENDQRAHHNLSSQFADLGLALGLDVKELKEEALYQLIYQRLAAKGRGLVVIDDAPNYEVVKSFLPERFGHREMGVLITSRNSHTFDSVLTKILLDVFTLHDAKQYIHRLLKETIDADAEVLATTLDRYPLALTQALAYILNNQCTIAEYCQRYTTLRAAQKKYLETPVYEDDPYQLEHQQRKRKFEATMKAVIQMSLEQIEMICDTKHRYEQVKTLLMAAAYVAAESPIPKEVLEGWLPDDKGELELSEALEVLRTFSLLEEAKEASGYRVHQVVQEVLKLGEGKESSVPRLLRWQKIIRNYLRSSVPSLTAVDEKKFLELKAHAIILAEQLSRESRTEDILSSEGALYLTLGIASQVQGKFKESKFYYEMEEACHRQRPVSTSQTEDAATCLMNLAGAVLGCGDPHGAKEKLEKALPIVKATHGEGHADVGRCLSNLGWAALQCGDPRGAKEILEAALPILQATLGNDHADIGMVLLNLGGAMLSSGDTMGAKKKFEAALPILRISQGERHTAVGTCLMNLGWVAMQCGDPGRAKEIIEEALQILIVTRGEEHAEVGGCLASLGAALLSSGDSLGAKQKFEAALPILRATLGERHADVARCLANLGSAIMGCGNPLDAQEKFEVALPILTTTLGKENATVGLCLMNLGLVRLQSEDSLGAKEKLEAALPIQKAALGEEHPDVGRCWMGLGMVSFSEGDTQSAEHLLKKAVDIFIKAWGENHPVTQACLEMYQDALQQNNQPAQSASEDRLVPVKKQTASASIRRAAGEGTLDELQRLLDEALPFANEPDQKEGSGRTALHWAVINRRPEHVGLLLVYVGYTTLQDKRGRSALDYALETGDPHILDHFKTALMTYYSIHQEALLPILVSKCTEASDQSALKLLIHFKVSVIWMDEVSGQTALHRAVIRGDQACIKLLLSAGADSFQEDFEGRTALSLAEEKDESLVVMMLQAGSSDFQP